MDLVQQDIQESHLTVIFHLMDIMIDYIDIILDLEEVLRVPSLRTPYAQYTILRYLFRQYFGSYATCSWVYLVVRWHTCTFKEKPEAFLTLCLTLDMMRFQ